MQLLKELVDVEIQLVQKNSTIAGTYATSVALNIVGVLYTYHCCLLVSQEQTVAVFDGFVILLINLLYIDFTLLVLLSLSSLLEKNL